MTDSAPVPMNKLTKTWNTARINMVTLLIPITSFHGNETVVFLLAVPAKTTGRVACSWQGRKEKPDPVVRIP
ncbi:hypothetical protein FsymDg_2597 [Candidatus Protofrankia datiscae]|uniref:Uncharacterized protein n=1 Tax=Candidatus Protofrankia datiscae TaxID=2716812 RepID=F8B344_9ACTN|nr:hypothetical protein FsymDg_2597 [Candidatus Protofrankia datiscae]